jgi:hypothetical protein
MEKNRTHLMDWMSCKLKFVILYIKHKLYEEKIINDLRNNKNEKNEAELEKFESIHNESSQQNYSKILPILQKFKFFDKQTSTVENNQDFFKAMMISRKSLTRNET